MDYKYIEEKLNQELIDSGLSKEEIMELRANSSFDLLVKAEKPYMSKKPYDNELSYLQYDGEYYLLYVIKADIPETGKPHIHFKNDEAALNIDGTWHDSHKKLPKLTNKIKEWILGNRWKLPSEE